MENSSQSKAEAINLALVSLIVLTFTYGCLAHLAHEVADEGFHAPQIWQFFHGNFTPSQYITVPPTYHAIIAGLLKVYGEFSVTLARVIQVFICSLTIPVLYLISKQLGHQNNDYRTLLFLTCPIALPFFSILYTDIPSVLLAILILLLTLQQRYFLAAFVGAGAIAMRQPNLIWVIFCATYVFLDYLLSKGWKNTFNPRDRENWKLVLKLLPYGIVGLGAALIFFLRNTVAIGDAAMHQISLNLSNLYMFLLLSFLLFLPYHIIYLPRIARCLVNYPAIWILCIAGLALYLLTHSNSHGYNTIGLAYYYRNVILHYTVTITWLKFLTFIPIAISAFTYYFFWKDSRPQHKLLLGLVYVFGALSFVPLPMVEPRYYLTALALIMVVKPSLLPKLDLACLFIYAPISALLLFLISRFIIFI